MCTAKLVYEMYSCLVYLLFLFKKNPHCILKIKINICGFFRLLATPHLEVSVTVLRRVWLLHMFPQNSAKLDRNWKLNF